MTREPRRIRLHLDQKFASPEAPQVMKPPKYNGKRRKTRIAAPVLSPSLECRNRLGGSPARMIRMTSERTTTAFVKPSAVEALFNRTFGFLVGLGIGPKFIYLLQVRGRKTGKIYSAPVNMMDLGGKLYLVAPRGRANWVRNAEAAREVTLKRGASRQRYALGPIPDDQKPPLLKEYLDRYASAVRKFFPVPPGSPVEAFRGIAANYPVFELSQKS